MKTYNVEVQRFKAISNSNGHINAQIDAIVQPCGASEGREPTSWLSLTEENARVLLSLLKAQLAELDKRKAKSRR